MPDRRSDTSQSLRKILISGGCAIMVLLAIFFYIERSFDQTKQQLIGLQKDVLKAANSMLMMRRHEKDFIARVENQYVEKMESEYQSILSQIGQINTGVMESEISIDYNGQQALANVDAYTQRFFKLGELVVVIHGADQGEGLIEHFKDKVLTLEHALIRANSNNIDQIALVTKDLMYQFFSDLDPNILPRIDRNLTQLQQAITQEQLGFETFSQFQEFKLAFYALQSAYEEFGYTHQQGELGKLRATIHQLEQSLNSLFTDLPPLIAAKLSDYESYRVMSALALVAAIILVLLSVTQRVTALEKQLIQARKDEAQASRAKSAFLANMSHEIRTPLNGILGMTEILSDTKLSASQKDYLETINASSQTLLMLINDILDLSKIESGHLEICPHTTAIKETIYDTAALIAPKAQQKSLDIIIDIDPNVPDYVQADEQKVRQTLMNLASNAIKFTDTGSISFALKAIHSSDTEVSIGFSVKDTGIGIDPEKQRHVFEEFKQENSDTSKHYGGTGLGLAICAKMVEMMGGKIELQSKKGSGSLFGFTLTFPRDNHEVNSEESLSIAYISQKPSALLINDLQRFGCNLTQLSDVSDELLNLSTNTIVISDDAHQIAQLQKASARYRFVLLRDNKHGQENSDINVDGYLTAPLFGNRMMNTLRQIAAISRENMTSNHATSNNADGTHTLVTSAAETENTSETVTSTESNEDLNRRHFKILVVEDNKVNQQIVSLNLKKLSIDFVIANNGQEAVDIYQHQHDSIGLILMDCMMPVLDGFEATKAIRDYEKSEEIKQTHIIALTASVLDDDIKRCYDSGMDDYLPKPFKRDILMEKLDARIQAS
ncbi:ATP-binding protein [Vibrio variabilis]|uniref:ATP-binding protein n=1 Tax=Vibrio variabilis TaxID=990271 RepID=UPI000DD54E47|nr:ATP-binding protein [Vibrio variabilis]